MARPDWFRWLQTSTVEQVTTLDVAAVDQPRLLGSIVFASVTLGFAALIVGAVLADALRLSLTLPIMGLAALLIVAPLLITIRRPARLPRFDLPTDLALVGVAAVLAWRLLAPAWPSLLPVGNSPDAVHHTALANYLFQWQRLVPNAQPARELLIEMADYPPGFAILTTFAAQLGNLLPVQVIYPLAALIVLATVTGLALLIAEAVTISVRPLAAVVSLAVLLMPGYALGIVADQNYYPQALAQLLIVAVTYEIVRYQRSPNRSRLWRVALLLLALVFSYTTWLPVALVVVGLGIVFQPAPWRRRIAQLAVVIVPVVVVAAWYSRSRATTGTTVLLHEGSTIRAPFHTIGWIVPIFAFVGIVRGWRSPTRRGGIWLIVAALMQTAALWLLWQRGTIAGYIYYKSYYLLALVLVVPPGWLLADAVTWLGQRWRGSRVVSVVLQSGFALGLIVVSAVFARPTQAAQPLSPGLLQAASWVRQHGMADDVAYALQAPGLPAYWLQVGVLGQPRNNAANALLSAPPLQFAEWYFNPEAPRTLILEQPTLPLPVAGLAIRLRNGCCMVVEKDESYAAALTQLRPLLISYRTGMDGDQLRITVDVFDQLQQAGLQLRLVAQSEAGALASYTIPVPQRAGRVQRLGIALDPRTLAATGYANDSELRFAAATNTTSSYRLRLQLLQGATIGGEGAPATVDEGAPTILQPAGMWTFYQPPMRSDQVTPRGFWLGDGIALTGSALDRATAQAGETLQLRLRWQATQAITTRYTTFVQLIAADGGAAMSVDGEPNGGVSPTWRWQAGATIDDLREIRLPADLKPGSYQVVVGMYDPATGQRLEAWQRSPSLVRFWTDALPLGTIEVR